MSIVGQMPLLELTFNKRKGVKLAQSLSILGYLGNVYGFEGRGPLQKAQVSVLAEAVSDASRADGISDWALILSRMKPMPGEFNGDKSAYFTAKVIPSMEKHAQMIDKFLAEHEEVFGGESVTWAEVRLRSSSPSSLTLGPIRQY